MLARSVLYGAIWTLYCHYASNEAYLPGRKCGIAVLESCLPQLLSATCCTNSWVPCRCTFEWGSYGWLCATVQYLVDGKPINAPHGPFHGTFTESPSGGGSLSHSSRVPSDHKRNLRTSDLHSVSLFLHYFRDLMFGKVLKYQRHP